MEEQQIFAHAAANRRRAADMLAGLTPEQWQVMSLCDGWTIRVLAGHMLMPMWASFPKALVRLIPARGNFNKVTDDISRELSRRPTDELVRTLRDKADTRAKVPFVGASGPMVDSCIHLRDAARPLGLDVDVSLEDWAFALTFLTGPKALLGFLPKGRLDGLALQATDQDFRSGEGAEVSGPSEALAMAIAGRRVALADLSGEGVRLLDERTANRG